MEVIQNADDNKYAEGQTPTVSITVFPKQVKIECNELGFSKKNVQALCRTGQSSKPPGQGYTGEKGIGFKSVFKLANRVHIRSEPYYFQLDQRRDLGMITPLWDKDFFDDIAEKHKTTIILDDICNESRSFSSTLQKDVDAIDPALLIFLRRIERLHLTLLRSASDVEPAIRKRFRRVHWTPTSGIVSLKDEDTKSLHHFYKQKFTTTFKGAESRRPNMIETDVVLAFPAMKRSGSYIPLIRKQNFAFAWLPLADLGFKVRHVITSRRLLLIPYTVCYPGGFSYHFQSAIRRRRQRLEHKHRRSNSSRIRSSHQGIQQERLRLTRASKNVATLPQFTH
jgi:hypothetical protein